MKTYFTLTALILTAFILGTVVRTTLAGSLTPPGSPASTMYTLDAIYNKLIDSTTSATEGAQSFSTPGSPSATFHTLKQIYDAIPTIDASKVLSGTTYLGVDGTATAGSAGVLKTGQTTCWATDGTSIPDCTGTGQDGDSPRGAAHSYTDNSDGTITDNATGLMWKKCSEGQSGSDCASGTAATMDWGTATTTCEADTTGGYTNWHVPNQNELFSLVDFGTINPAINTTIFPNTQSGLYWSATTYQFPGSENFAWYVYFSDGSTGAYNKTNSYYVRCVRG